MSAPRLTSEGWWALGLTLGVGLVAVRLGDVLGLLLFASAVALWLEVAWLGWQNLRGLTVARRLPHDLFANVEAAGALAVRSSLGGVRGRELVIAEEGFEDASARVDGVFGEEGRSVPFAWTFAHRGRARLAEMSLRSSWPFGWLEFQRDLVIPTEVVVFPRASGADSLRESGVGEGDEGATMSYGAFGDFQGLRDYIPGDSVRSIHWRTSARVGQLVVAQREGEGEPVVWVRVASHRGERWERELSRATGAILRAGVLGARVGLELQGDVWQPQAGDAWRRELLERLALAEVRS